MHTLGQHGKSQIVLDATDIGGTNATSKYVDMRDFAKVHFFVTLGTTLEGTADGWSSSDALDSFYLVQATDTAGTGAKAITGATNNQTAAGTAGTTYCIDLDAVNLDEANSFRYVAAYVAETGNTATDTVTIAAVQYGSRYKHDDLTASAHTSQ